MRRFSAIRLLALFVCLFACASAGEPVAVTPAKPAVPNSDCMDCHEAEFKPLKKGEPAVWTGVRPEILKKSVHGKLNCVDCHAGIAETPHPSKLPPRSASPVMRSPPPNMPRASMA